MMMLFTFSTTLNVDHHCKHSCEDQHVQLLHGPVTNSAEINCMSPLHLLQLLMDISNSLLLTPRIHYSTLLIVDINGGCHV